MDQSGRVLTISRAQAVAYRPSDGDHGSAKQPSKTNFVVKVEADGPDGERFVGLGESQPRGGETGDRGRQSWDFLLDCLRTLEGQQLPSTDPAAAMAAIGDLMGRFRGAAAELIPTDEPPASLRRTMRGWVRRVARRTGQVDDPVPFRGTLAGLEVALVDVVARAMDRSVAGLVGAGHVDTDGTAAYTPVVVSGGLTKALEWLADPMPPTTDVPLWLDVRCSFGPADAGRFLQAVAEAIGAGRIGPRVVVEQPVRNRYRHVLPRLQRKANAWAAKTGRSDAEIRLMAGASVFSRQGLDRLMARGGCGALAIRPAAVGGLVAARELAEAAMAAKPDIRIHVSQLDGGGRIARATVRQLAAALPRVDAVAVHGDESGDTPETPGLGVTMPYSDMIDTITEMESFPAEDFAARSGPQPNVYDEVPFLQPLGPNGTKGHLLEREALALGLSTTRYSKGAFVATDGVHEPLPFKWSRSPLSSAVSLALCTHKEATRMRLARAGVPVPKGRTFANGDYDSARAFAERIGYPVVVKPAMGVRGIGVVANIQSEAELTRAFEHLEESKLGGQDFIVEKHVTGRDYRIVVVGDEVIAAILREPASVVGDGTRSVAELVVRKNLVRRLNPHLWGRPIKYDAAARYQLERAGMTLDSVPAEGQRVLLSSSCSLSQGGDSIDVLDELHPSIKDACVRAVQAVPGLSFCGVDFLLEDHTKPVDEQEAGICELNAHAAIGNCEYPLYGQPREVARTFMRLCVDRFDLVTRDKPAETLALHLTIRGRVTKVGYRAWMRRRAESFGVRGWVRNVNERTVEAVIVGDTAPASALAAAAVLGPKNALPTSVATVHVEPPDVTGFDIVDHAPQELVHVG